MTLAQGCTVCKIQGLILTQIVDSFTLLKRKIFNYGQIYVVLSTVASFEGLYILGSITVSATRANSHNLKEHNRMPHERMLVIDKQWLVITLLNIRS